MRDWLVDIRLKNKLTQEQVAERADIERSYYNMIERGKRRPSVEIAKKIANVLSIDWTIFLSRYVTKRYVNLGGYKMTTKEKIEFIKQVTPHSDSEVEKIIKGMSDTSINRWYEIEKYRIDQELEEAVLTIYC